PREGLTQRAPSDGRQLATGAVRTHPDDFSATGLRRRDDRVRWAVDGVHQQFLRNPTVVDRVRRVSTQPCGSTPRREFRAVSGARPSAVNRTPDEEELRWRRPPQSCSTPPPSTDRRPTTPVRLTHR